MKEIKTMAINPAVWPDIAYIADQIAEHYRALQTALEAGQLTLAEEHLREMESRVQGLRTYIACAGDWGDAPGGWHD